MSVKESLKVQTLEVKKPVTILFSQSSTLGTGNNNNIW